MTRLDTLAQMCQLSPRVAIIKFIRLLSPRVDILTVAPRVNHLGVSGEPATADLSAAIIGENQQGIRGQKAFWLEMGDEIMLSLGISACAEIV